MTRPTGAWAPALRLVVLAALLPTAAMGQIPGLPAAGKPEATAEPEAEPRETVEGLERRLREVEAELAALGGETPDDERREPLHAIERLLTEHRLALERRAELDARETDLAADLAGDGLVEGAGPYDVATLDSLLDRLATTRSAQTALEEAAEGQEEAVEAAESRLAEAQEALRRARRGDDAGATADLALAELSARVARERLALQEAVLANDRRERELLDRQETALDQAVANVRERLQPTPEDHQRVLQSAERRGEELARRRSEAEALLAEARDARRGAERRLPPGEEPAPALAAELAARRRAFDVAQRRLDLVESAEDRASRVTAAAETRLRLLQGELTRDAELRQAREKLTELHQELERERQRRASALEQTRAELAELDDRLETLPEDDPRRRWLREERRQLQAAAELYRDALRRLEDDLARVERPRAAIAAAVADADLGERLAAGWEQVRGIWRYPLFNVQAGDPVTVRSLVLALVLVILGLMFSRWLAGMLEKRLAPRFKLDPGAAATFRTLTYYLLAVLFVLWALWLVKIPLTVFTVLGGALAIGVGFGSQNIVNNFISGLIMMAERPVKVGDLIEIESTHGTVEHIGARSTRIRSGDNTHVIVPNSTFLENNILNWTVSDNIIRTALDVGVAYGSPTRRVAELLAQATAADDRVITSPAPEVLFVDFAADALAFRVYFWMRVRAPLDRIRVQSEMRYRIEELFREDGITIAYPQRDVHLDVVSPLPVRMVPAADEES